MNNPTPEQVRNVRHVAFNNAVAHISDENRRNKFIRSYQKQDGNRERNVTNFYRSILGDRK